MSDETFRLDDFEDVLTAEVRIKNPATGAPTPMVVTLAGPEHPDRKRIQFNKSRRLRAELSKTGKLPVTDPEDDEADETEMLVACTIGWTGAEPAFSKQAARAVYVDPKRRWLRDQVLAAMNERELFTRASVQS